MWTIEHGGVEKSFAEWGIVADLPYDRTSQAPDALHIITTDDFASALAFTHGGKAIVRRDRVLVGAAWTAGSVWFQGFIGSPNRKATGGRQNHRYSIYGPWWILERCQYQQARKIFMGYTDPLDPESTPIYETRLDSEVTLGEDLDEAAEHSGQVITRLINWANECWNPTRRGATVGIDPAQDLVQIPVGGIGVSVPVPRYPIRDQKVAECIRQMLRWSQDAICYFDYSVTPPAVYVRTASALGLWELETVNEALPDMSLVARYDRVIPGVVIRYRKTKEVNGFICQDVVTDKYPLATNEYDPDASVHTIELIGSRLTTVRADLVCSACNAQAADAATRLAWWKKFEPSLKDGSLDAAAISLTVADVVDANGDPINLSTYPYVLEAGQIASWMTANNAPALSIRATVSATLVYTKRKTGTTLDLEQATKPLHTQVVLTNAPSGPYETTSHFDPGEDVPVGLAQALYTGFAGLQHEGTITLVGDQVPANPSLGNKLTLTTGGVSMTDILVQGIHGNLARGEVTLHVGPPGQVGLTDLIEIHRVNRNRMVFNLPSGRSDGAAGGGSQNVALGKTTSRENTTAGVAERKLSTETDGAGGGNSTMIKSNATQQEWSMRVVDGNGSPVTGQAGVTMALSALGGRTAQFYELRFKDATTCALYRTWVLGTEPELVP